MSRERKCVLAFEDLTFRFSAMITKGKKNHAVEKRVGVGWGGWGGGGKAQRGV